MPPGTEGAAALSVYILVEAPDNRPRRREPVTCGIPWPKGNLVDPSRLCLEDACGQPVVLQTRVLDRWSDGSVRWLLLDWQGDAVLRSSFVLRPSSFNQEAATAKSSELRVQAGNGQAFISTGTAEFYMGYGGFPFESVRVAQTVFPAACFSVEDDTGREYRPRIEQLHVEETGPVRVCIYVRGQLIPFSREAERSAGGHAPLRAAAKRRKTLAYFEAYLDFLAGSATVRCKLSLGNPHKAQHPGGYWDLGGGGSIFVKDASLMIALPAAAEPGRITCSPDLGAAYELCLAPLELYQDSSGGENWQSSNHVNRNGVVPNTFRGYRLRTGSRERTGLRATPVVTLARGHSEIGIAVPQFWQNFPKAVEATTDTLIVRLFPHQYADVHEIQGGEQKTHNFYLAWARDTVTAEPLAWCRSPLLARASPEWYAATGAVPYLVPRAQDPHATYLAHVHAAIEGEDTFFHKREAIDAYGWRHYGEVYGDHEAVFHHGPTPLVSHYNNQYDPVAGFAYQFLRSGDPRWWTLMDDLAGHIHDIDIYHTDADKSAYNHGLFWHTCHYIDAGTATHRSYPRAAQTGGGGPGNEHNYTTGLLLHHFLTGDPRSRRAALELAQWVLDMDDGRRTVFRWLARGDTGLASASATPFYHGPGRGGANSLNALLDGYRLSGRSEFRAKLEQLLHRCIHPADDIAARGLLDPESRWSYTMFLQALGRYLDDKIERGELDAHHAYARASLLHYARWMAEHEIPYLDRPERLHFPTETWAAQDMRKSEVFKYAALHAIGPERARFLERARFFFDYSVTTLTQWPTRTRARPVILLLSYGIMQSYFDRNPPAAAPPPAVEGVEFGKPEVFVPQKVRAMRRFKMLVLLVLVVGTVTLAGLVRWYWR